MHRLAFKTLISNRGKSVTAIAGVVFSLVLVSIQGGLYVGLMRKASILVDHSGADLWIGHKRVELVDLPENIPQIYVNRVRGLPGVAAAEPYVVGHGYAVSTDGTYENVWLIGADPSTMLGGGWSFTQGSRRDLRRPNGVSIDEYDEPRLGYPRLNEIIEINGRRARVVAKTRGVTPFTTTPYLFMTLDNARRYSGIPPDSCSYFLVRAESGTDLAGLRDAIQQRLPDLAVYTSEEFSRMSQAYWMRRTGIGISFGAATLLGLFVGLVMVGQSLYALALDHLDEYATLLAIGATSSQVRMVVVLQALIVAAIGTVVGVALVLVIQGLWASPLAPIEIPLELLIGGIGLVFGICLLATILPANRIRKIDPQVVLQG